MPRAILIRRTVVSLVLIVILIAAGSFVRGRLASRKEPPERATEIEKRIAVKVAEARRGPYVEQLSGYGRARAMRRTEVAAEVAGLVLKLAPALEAGNEVAADQPLVWLDDRDRKNQVASIEARLVRNEAEQARLVADLANIERQLEIAREELEVAERELARVEKLVERGVATSSDRDAETLRITMRRAAVARFEGDRAKNEAQRKSNDADRADLQVSLKQARTELDRCVVRAPYAGRIETRMVQKGGRVAPGTTLFELVDLEHIEIPVSLPASRFGDVTIGAKADVVLPGSGDDHWVATVARLAPTVRADDRTFVVYLESTGKDAVPPGAFVTAKIAGRRYENVFAVPRTAFVQDRLFVAKDGKAHARQPRIVKALPATILCDAGVEDGERIIITNLEEVADGSRVAATANPAATDDA
ncbi:MAG: efflux RND transporter periplasmic adaptor subunit [Planctomycetota bacterium]|jgi:multidrug resistance efflux pump